jgi:quercetin dioxygenase-like cupin family protein
MKYFHNWSELKAVDHGLLSSLCKIKAITGDKLQLIWARFEPGGEYETHSHPHEQFSFMVEGKMRLFVGDQEKVVGPGDIWYAPPNVVHGGKLLGDAPVLFVDVFTPIREDVLEEMKVRGGN